MRCLRLGSTFISDPLIFNFVLPFENWHRILNFLLFFSPRKIDSSPTRVNQSIALVRELWQICNRWEKISADIFLQQILLSIALVQCSINQSVLALSEESVTVETFDGGQQEKLLLVLDYKTIFKGDHRPPYTCWLWKPNKYFRLYHQIQLAMKCSKTISDLIMKNRCSYCNIYC